MGKTEPPGITWQRHLLQATVRLGEFGTVPDLVADFLLVLFPVADAAAAEEDDGDDDEEEEDDDDGHGDDAWSVGRWRGREGGEGGREAGERRCGQCSVDSTACGGGFRCTGKMDVFQIASQSV